MRFPRLEALLGVAVDALDLAALERAVQLAISEGADLDWKRELYSIDEKGRAELAKDVAALANAAGGVIVLGVAERNGRADALTPVPLSDSEQRRMREIVAERVRPFVAGLDIRQVESGQEGIGFYVIGVPLSADAPHAARVKHSLGYPVRNEETTRWLSESEVAVRYRDRFAARTVLAGRVHDVHEQAASRLQRRLRAWVTVAVVPTTSGQRTAGAAATARGLGFVYTWARAAPPLTATAARSDGGLTGLPGIRRVIISSAAPYAGVSDEVHLELHHDGAGFGACVVGIGSEPRDGHEPTDIPVWREHVELEVLALVSLLSQHAVDVGAAGELLLRAQLLLPLERRPGQGPTPTAIHAPRYLPQGMWLSEEKVSGSLTLTETTATSVSALLSDTAAMGGGCIRTAHALAADLLSEFGVTEPSMLQPDGTVRLDGLAPAYQQQLTTWASMNDLFNPP